MNASPIAETEDDAEPQGPGYAYKPNLVGAPWEFVLKPEGLEWQYGRRSSVIRYDRIQRVRMSYRPASLQSYRFLTEIWAPDGPKIKIFSTSFRGLMEMARQDAAYTGFVTELHRRLAAAKSTAQFSSGTHPIIYWLGAAVFVAIGLGLIAFLIRMLTLGELTASALAGGVFLLFLWQIGAIFYRNRPQIYRPEAPPDNVLPRG